MAKRLASLRTDCLWGLYIYICICADPPFNFESGFRHFLWLVSPSRCLFPEAPASTLPTVAASNSTRSPCQTEPVGRVSWTHWSRFRVFFFNVPSVFEQLAILLYFILNVKAVRGAWCAMSRKQTILLTIKLNVQHFKVQRCIKTYSHWEKWLRIYNN